MGVGRPTSVARGGIKNRGPNKIPGIYGGDKLGTGHTPARVTFLSSSVQLPSYLTDGVTRGAAIVSR